MKHIATHSPKRSAGYANLSRATFSHPLQGLALGFLVFHMGCVTSLAAPQNTVGSVAVALQSIGTFDNYVDTLQPKFVLTTEDALQKAIPVTQLADLQTLRAFAASLRLALPSLSLSKQEVTTTSAGSSTDTATTTRSSGSTSLKDLPSPPAAAAPTVTPLSIPAGTQPGVDALLQYRTATALLQEVALLSSYVRDAAVRRGSVPYVVRLLLTVFPARHESPYDAYTLISFVAPPNIDESAPPTQSGPQAADSPTVPGMLGRNFLELPDNDQRAITEMIDAVLPVKKEIPIEVVPLFVTDAVDASFRSMSDVSTKGFDASLGGGVGGASATAGVASNNTDAARFLGQALNGTQTLSRPATNVVVVRLGASYIGKSFTLLPRTYSVTVLLLVPTAASEPALLNRYLQAKANLATLADSISFLEVFKTSTAPLATAKGKLKYLAGQVIPRTLLRYSAMAEFVNVDTGRHASLPGAKWLEDTVKREWSSAGGSSLTTAKTPPRSEVQAIINAILTPDYTAFENGWGTGASRAWPRMALLAQACGYSGGTFTVPPAVFRAPTADQLIGRLLKDDGEAMTLSLSDFFGLSTAGDLDAVLTVTWTDAKGKTASQSAIRNLSSVVSGDSRGATLTFPSLVSVAPLCDGDVPVKADASVAGVPANTQKSTNARPHPAKGGVTPPSQVDLPAKTPCRVGAITMALAYSPHTMSSLFSDFSPPPPWQSQVSLPMLAVNYASVQKPKSSLSVTMQSPRVVVDDQGKGEVAIELHSKGDAELAKLVVEGADIASVIGTVTNKGADRIVLAGQRLTIQFENLVAGAQVRVHVQSNDEKHLEASGSPANAVAVARPMTQGTKPQS